MAAYTMMLKERYCDALGVLVEEYPSYYQFRFFYRKTRKPYRQSAGYLQNANRFLETEKCQSRLIFNPKSNEIDALCGTLDAIRKRGLPLGSTAYHVLSVLCAPD